MKKLFLLILLLSSTVSTFAQWTSSGANTYFNLTGNVGIGTNYPGSKLELNGMIYVNAQGQAGLHIYNGGANSEWFLYQKSQTSHSLSITRQVAGVPTDYLTFNPNGNSSFFGPLGIGTANPVGAGLTLAGASAPNPNTGAEADYSGLNLTFRSESQGQNFNLGTIKMVQPSGNFFDNADMVFLTCLQNPTEKMRIKGSGYVGIGTSNPREMLSVNGNIRSKQVKVETANWPDYVFTPTYTLTSLNALRNYIDVNGRLPEMPSAQQVQSEGQNLGEINKVLVKKVEELTLYLIEMDRQLKSQHKEIQQIKRLSIKTKY